MAPRDNVEPIAGAGLRGFATGEDGELDTGGEAFRMGPAGEGLPLVATHDPEDAGGGKPSGNRFGSLIGIRWACLLQLEVIDHGPGNPGGGEAEHFEPDLAAGGGVAGLVRGNPARQETDLIQSERVLRQGGEMEMAEVDGIEGSAEDSDFPRCWHADVRNFTEPPFRGQFLPPVTDAFQILGLKPGLVFSEETLREFFREAGKQAHPDAGGGDGEFAALREAFAVVSSPSRRLRHWLERRGTPGEVRGTIDTSLMDLFSEVGAVTQQAEAVIRKRDEAKSSLVRAMLEGETQLCREAVERAISLVEASIIRECSVFPDLEIAADPDLDAASKVARNLAFLEKWRAGLRSCFARLI